MCDKPCFYIYPSSFRMGLMDCFMCYVNEFPSLCSHCWKFIFFVLFWIEFTMITIVTSITSYRTNNSMKIIKKRILKFFGILYGSISNHTENGIFECFKLIIIFHLFGRMHSELAKLTDSIHCYWEFMANIIDIGCCQRHCYAVWKESATYQLRNMIFNGVLSLQFLNNWVNNQLLFSLPTTTYSVYCTEYNDDDFGYFKIFVLYLKPSNSFIKDVIDRDKCLKCRIQRTRMNLFFFFVVLS